jgi:hypothetical protein
VADRRLTVRRPAAFRAPVVGRRLGVAARLGALARLLALARFDGCAAAPPRVPWFDRFDVLGWDLRFVEPERAELFRFTLELRWAERPPPPPPRRPCAVASVTKSSGPGAMSTVSRTASTARINDSFIRSSP